MSEMLYLSGAPRAEVMRLPGLGLMLVPKSGGLRWVEAGVPWAADNGCFSQGASFDLVRYLAWLDRMAPYRESCLFATAPDVLADAEATWARSKDVLPILRARGYKAALVAQDDIEDMAEIAWDAFDALFLGGSTAWKLSSVVEQLGAEARAHGLHLHMGRVNSGVRYAFAERIGCQSVDGTYLKYGPDKGLRRIGKWLPQRTLPWWEVTP